MNLFERLEGNWSYQKMVSRQARIQASQNERQLHHDNDDVYH
jgi:hypothetical protein